MEGHKEIELLKTGRDQAFPNLIPADADVALQERQVHQKRPSRQPATDAAVVFVAAVGKKRR